MTDDMLKIGSVFVTIIEELEDTLKQLKLEKRDLILANKKTSEIDREIMELKRKLEIVKSL